MPIEPVIFPGEFADWEKAYFKGPKHERYGQAFMNHFHGRVPRDDHDLWEEKNVKKAQNLVSKYIIYR